MREYRIVFFFAREEIERDESNKTERTKRNETKRNETKEMQTNYLTPELVASLDDGPVPRDVRLGTQSVVRLPATQSAGDAIHRERRRLLIHELLDQFLVLRGVYERYDGAIFEHGRLLRRRRTKLVWWDIRRGDAGREPVAFVVVVSFISKNCGNSVCVGDMSLRH